MSSLYVILEYIGLCQATERNEVGFTEMVQLDIRYIQRSKNSEIPRFYI